MAWEQDDLRAEFLLCAGCEQSYPICQLGDRRIPWLFADPLGAAADWQARYRDYLHRNRLQQSALHSALANKGLTVRARERLERQLTARAAESDQVCRLLRPLGFSEESDAEAMTLAQAAGPGSHNLPGDRLDSLANAHSMTSYLDNLFRDWAWDNGEAQAQCAALIDVLPADAGLGSTRLLTLGSGAGRLAYDMHQYLESSLSVQLDLNPLLLIAGAKVMDGDGFMLPEFPLAPLNNASHAVSRRCQRLSGQPNVSANEVGLVLADVMRAPFARASFDTVITPWLLDVLPYDLADVLPQINRLLPPGGLWLNTGSLAFFHRDQRWCYSEEELLELVEHHGFELVEVQRVRLPYLQSPASAHWRQEAVLSFSALKVSEQLERSIPNLQPSWLRKPDQPIPQSADMVTGAAQGLLQTQVLSAVDGRRSVDDITQLIADRYQLAPGPAATAVKRILVAAGKS